MSPPVAAATSAGAAGTVVFVTAIWAAMGRRLDAVLRDLCDDEDRARFWTRMCLVELTAGIALAATLAVARGVDTAADPGAAAASVARWQLAGGIAGVAVIALVVLRETHRAGQAAPADGAVS
ncbi:MAG TPA: hypothetical protein VFO60_02695 [Candidatus Dormibacteraeota bacterium]|nr:hypothetical protein [Candidatus Dormibacteraeota bacterium]